MGSAKSAMTADDLIAYWSQLGSGTVHPDDGPYIGSQNFATTLCPIPWAGPIKGAKVYLLFLNPGLSPEDLAWESDNADFSSVLRANIREGSQPYFYLLDRFYAHPGHRWARATFGSDIQERHAERFCVVQLVPYHSDDGGYARSIATGLPSSKAARQFVRDTLVPKARAGQIGLVVARSSKLWQIEGEDDCLVIYRGGECRRAFQTSGTRGGILLRKMI